MLPNDRHHALGGLGRVTLAVALLSAAALSLQGCDGEGRRACKIDDIYTMIQVDGKTGHSKFQLEKFGVKLCARHLRKMETYAGDGCTDPQEVFSGGDLPTAANGDSNALLLIRCPGTAYPRGKELQRVTCSDDYLGENGDGSLIKALRLRFDNYQVASNCLLSMDDSSNDAQSDAKVAPMQVMMHETEAKQGNASTAPAPMIVRSDKVVSPASDGKDAELAMAAATAALTSDKVGGLLAKTDVTIHAHGTIGHRRGEGHHHRKNHAAGDSHHRKPTSEEQHRPDHGVRSPLFRAEYLDYLPSE